MELEKAHRVAGRIVEEARQEKQALTEKVYNSSNDLQEMIYGLKRNGLETTVAREPTFEERARKEERDFAARLAEKDLSLTRMVLKSSPERQDMLFALNRNGYEAKPVYSRKSKTSVIQGEIDSPLKRSR